jgi:hypothetical protein
MIPVINVRHDTKRIVAELRADRENVTKAQARALNRTAEQLRTEAGREIRKEYNVTLRGIRQASKIRRASPRSKFPRAEVSFSGRAINLFEFGARQVKKGVTVKVKVRGGRKLIESAFLQTIKSGQNAGKRGVFRRVGKARYPIRFLPSISIPQMTEVKAVSGALLKFADVRFEANLRHELTFLMRR